MKVDKTNKDVEDLMNKANNLINNTISKINYELINMYWELGRMITNYKERKDSKYGDAVIERFRKELSLQFGKGFSITNIKYAVRFYSIFQKSPPVDQIQKCFMVALSRTIYFK